MSLPSEQAADGRKLCMITGASTGIGKVTARKVAQAGFDVVLVCRDRERGEAAVADVRHHAPEAAVELMLADLSSQAAIRELAREFRARHASLDVLINNAGGMLMERRTTVDGLEATFATNHLGYFLLTNLLLPALEASPNARVVNVASDAHRSGSLDFDDLNHEKRYRGFRAYCASKLANVLFTYELARRLDGRGVTVNCLHPGVVGSNFGQGEGNGWMRVAIKIAKPFMISVEDGARTSVYLATSPEVEGVSGKYFTRCKPVSSSRKSQDAELARRLWEVSEKLTGLAG